MVRIKGVHHLAMATRDMNGTIRFWRDLLGLRLVAGLGKKGYKFYFFEMSPDNYVVFFEWPGVEPVPEKDHGYPFSGPLVFDHVSFRVENDEMLWEVKDKLEAAGFWASDPIDHGIIHSVYAFDPNGIPIEFTAVVEGIDIGLDPKLVDSSPVPAALEGPEPDPAKWPAVLRPTPPEDRAVFPGEGTELVSGEKKNRWEGLPKLKRA
ncbi:MAG: VOC family protein [Desulfobacteraceae bacterium]|nr:VOC family protein [Desulfobacteraceae bacterium]